MLLKGLNKNERQIIWRKLHRYDKELLHCTINSTFLCNAFHYDDFISYAMTHGYIDLLNMQYISGPINNSIVYDTALYGHLDVLRWVIRKGLLRGTYDENIGHAAGCGGHLHIVEWYSTFCGIETFYVICNGAIQGGKTNILDHLKKNGYNFNIHTYNCAAFGAIEAVKWFLLNGIEFSNDDVIQSACHGKLSTFIALIEFGYTVDFDEVRRFAENNGHKNIVEYIDAAKGAQ